MSSLTPETIIELSTKGWKCDDYKNLCPIKEHKGRKNKLVYYPTGEDAKIEFLGNCVVMHISEIYSKIEQDSDGTLVIPPGKFIFFLTKEAVNMPMDIDGTLFMNPNYSNMGLLFFTLGHVDPGFHGYLTGAMLNMTSKKLFIDRHAGCLFLIFNTLEKPAKPLMKFHRNPQLSLSEAIINQGFNLDPGFALTKSDFVTRKELIAWIGIMIAIIAIMAAFLRFQ